MPFVNEYMSEADVAKYGILAINRRFIKSNYKPEWTRDHARDLYLREVAKGRDEYWQEVDFTFYWQGNLYVLRLRQSVSGTRGGTGQMGYGLISMAPQPESPTDHQTLLGDLKEALSVYGYGGMDSDMTITQMSFEF
jgi:hypothetical protein